VLQEQQVPLDVPEEPESEDEEEDPEEIEGVSDLDSEQISRTKSSAQSFFFR
jgi:hypothetical protein